VRPGRPCKVCADSVLAAKVDALLQTGESLRAIAALTGADRFSVQRHKRHAFPQAEAKPENLSELELSDQRLATLSDQLQQQYAAAVTCGDAKLAVEIVKTRARVETERHSRLLEKQETEADDATSEKNLWPTVQQYDNVKTKVYAAYEKWKANWGWVTCPVCENIKPIDPKIIPAKIKHYLETHAHDSAAN
jgi:hypothetical protein